MLEPSFLFVAPDPSHRPEERAPAMERILALDDHYPLTVWDVNDTFDYSRGMATAWKQPGTLVNIEHDMAVYPEQVAELLTCPCDLCAFAYWIAPATTGRHEPVIGVRLIEGESRWAYDTAIGLCKIKERQRLGTIPICDYKSVETYVWNRVGGPWHIHYPPVTHYHGFSEEQYAAWRQRDGQRFS